MHNFPEQLRWPHLKLARLDHVQLRSCQARIPLLNQDVTSSYIALIHLRDHLPLECSIELAEQQQLAQGPLQMQSDTAFV